MDMATGKISKWLVAEGAAVKQGEPLFEIETDKAAMEIDAPASGILRNVVAREGVDVEVGKPVAWIFAEGEAVTAAPAAASAKTGRKTHSHPRPPFPAAATISSEYRPRA